MSSLSSISGSLTSNLAVSGLATGFDTNKIIEGLLSLQQRQIDRLKSKQGEISQQQVVFGEVEAKLLGLQTQLTQLGRSLNGAFDGRQVTSSNEELLTAAAGGSANPGTYTLKVNSLARSHQLASQGFASSGSTISADTFTLGVGGAAETITIDGSNNTLQGLANAINNANVGVSATIINDGSATNPYRLLLTSSQTGAANAITISGNETGVDFSTTVQAATDASITLGSGAGALTINSGSNQIDGLIAGVALNLKGADAGKEITITVTNDTAQAKQAVTDFVDSYNDLLEYIDTAISFDSKTGKAGVLLGNSSVISIQDQVRSVVMNTVSGVNPAMNRLSALGISTNDAGRLVVDSSKLEEALTGKISGVTLGDVKRLFALAGQASNPGVTFVTGSSQTKAGTYQVEVSQVATQGSLTATNSLAASTVIDSSNNSFTITVNGQASGTITLTPNTYTRSELASAVQDAINNDTALAGRKVTVSLDTDKLRIMTDSYGSSAGVAIGSGTAITSGILGFTGSEAAGQGQDVAGKFIVNGVDETATGSGQFLVGSSGNANTADLQVRVTLAGPATTDLTVTRGLASQLDLAIDSLLDPVSGRLKTINDSLQGRIDDLQETIDQQNVLFEQRRESLVRQFVALESTVSQLKATGDMFTAQLASIRWGSSK